MVLNQRLAFTTQPVSVTPSQSYALKVISQCFKREWGHKIHGHGIVEKQQPCTCQSVQNFHVDHLSSFGNLEVHQCQSLPAPPVEIPQWPLITKDRMGTDCMSTANSKCSPAQLALCTTLAI